ncbi:hypothetical protein PVAP13_9KG009300 [Panicum virgatum]|nr:hypothetical protein PVAP13_9KG009300 [Panicum virgatum]
MGMATRASNSCLLLLPLALAIVVAAGSTAAAPATAAPPASPPFPDGVRVRRLVHGHGEHALDHGSLLVRLRVQPALRRHLLPPLHQPLLRRPPRRRLPGGGAQAALIPPALPLCLFHGSTAASNTSAADQAEEVGVNFAVAGATAIEHDFFARNNLSFDITPQSIMTQLGWFDAHLRAAAGNDKGSKTNNKVGDALFWVGEIGANDYAYTVVARDTIPPKIVRDMAVQRLTTFEE